MDPGSWAHTFHGLHYYFDELAGRKKGISSVLQSTFVRICRIKICRLGGRGSEPPTLGLDDDLSSALTSRRPAKPRCAGSCFVSLRY